MAGPKSEAIEWDLVEKVFMRELTRTRGPVTPSNVIAIATMDAVHAAVASQTRATLESGHDCGATAKFNRAGAEKWRKLACAAAAVAKLDDQSRAKFLELLGSDSCLRLGFQYGARIAFDCLVDAQNDPAYSSTDSLKRASWDPYNNAAGPVWIPSVPPVPQYYGPPPMVNWECKPFPTCLQDPANWPPTIPKACEPWPSCICSGPARLQWCPNEGPLPKIEPTSVAMPESLPALPAPSAPPTRPIDVPPSTGSSPSPQSETWYKTPVGLALAAVGSVLGIATIVAVSRSNN